MSTIILYGMPNCDTVKKARVWLTEHKIEHVFHDFRKDGLSASRLQTWTQQVTWDRLLNTRGTTWRKLTEAERADPNPASAEALMLAYPSLVKRPVVETGNGLLVGFDPAVWQAALIK